MRQSSAAMEPIGASARLSEQLHQFREFGATTRLIETGATLFNGGRITVPTFVNEFWTAKQRQASSLHEVSYRACFKPQLPRFFIERLTTSGDVVYDPFMGIRKTPFDIIGGQPFKYRRTDNGRFLLYSVGWNETDDGGEQGDWVWSASRN